MYYRNPIPITLILDLTSTTSVVTDFPYFWAKLDIIYGSRTSYCHPNRDPYKRAQRNVVRGLDQVSLFTLLPFTRPYV